MKLLYAILPILVLAGIIALAIHIENQRRQEQAARAELTNPQLARKIIQDANNSLHPNTQLPSAVTTPLPSAPPLVTSSPSTRPALTIDQ